MYQEVGAKKTYNSAIATMFCQFAGEVISQLKTFVLSYKQKLEELFC